MLGHRISNTFVRLAREYRGARLRSISRELFFHLSKNYSQTLQVNRRELLFELPTSDLGVGLPTFVTGPPERADFSSAMKLLNDLAILKQPPFRAFLEIGANIGTATVLALREYGFSSAICFEPAPYNFRLLKRNLELNQLSDQVRCFPYALSSVDGVVDFEISPSNFGDNRIVGEASRPDVLSNELRKIESVQSYRLESLVESSEIDLSEIDLVWIDAQGSEGLILEGAPSLLESRIPIVLELSPYLINGLSDCSSYMEQLADTYETIYDLQDQDSPQRYSPKDISLLFEKYSRSRWFDSTGAGLYTNILLLK